MKRFISKVGIACIAFVCLFLFEITPAQKQGIDFSVDSCRVEKIPGLDSVLVTAYIGYRVADSLVPERNVPVGVYYDDHLIYRDYPLLREFYSQWGYVWAVGGCSTPLCPRLGALGEGECLYAIDPPCFCFYPMLLEWRLEEPAGTQVTVIVDDLSAIPEFDETNNECSTIYSAPAIPTLTEWGLIILVVLLGFMSWVFLKRKKAVAVSGVEP